MSTKAPKPTTLRGVVQFTEREIDALISVCEMTTEPHAGVTFAGWGRANPGSVRALKAAERKLRRANGERV